MTLRALNTARTGDPGRPLHRTRPGPTPSSHRLLQGPARAGCVGLSTHTIRDPTAPLLPDCEHLLEELVTHRMALKNTERHLRMLEQGGCLEMAGGRRGPHLGLVGTVALVRSLTKPQNRYRISECLQARAPSSSHSRQAVQFSGVESELARTHLPGTESRGARQSSD